MVKEIYTIQYQIIILEQFIFIYLASDLTNLFGHSASFWFRFSIYLCSRILNVLSRFSGLIMGTMNEVYELLCEVIIVFRNS